MKISILILLTVQLASAVLVINESNIYKVLAQNPRVCFLLCTPVSRLCKKQEVELIKTEDRLGGSVLFGKIDPSTPLSTLDQLKINKNPMIYYFEQGSLKDTYKGPVYLVEMSTWIEAKLKQTDL
jgi:thioredoxin-like negative regulator of GroEL